MRSLQSNYVRVRLFSQYAVFYCLLLLFVGEAAQARAPNIVLILADDMGVGDISAYNPDSKIYTPQLDALASRGALFTDASTPSSVCTPTRYAILTGRYAWRTRLKSEVLWAWDPPLIDPSLETLPEILRTHGYSTALFGKWHLGWRWQTNDGKVPIGQGMIVPPPGSGTNVDFLQPVQGGPIDHGFDYFFGVDAPNLPPYGWIENDRLLDEPTIPLPKEIYGTRGPMVEGWSLESIAPTLTDRIVEYVLARKGESAPFFLYYAMTTPHTPIAPTSEWRGTSDAGLYGDFVQQLDAEIGRIYKALEETGQSEHTVLIFLADNGSTGFTDNNSRSQTALEEEFNHATSLGLRGYKLSIYEGGFRVPMIVVWPGKISSGVRVDRPFTAIDLLPTLAAIAEAEVAEGLAPDAVNVLDDWLGVDNMPPKRDHAIYHSYNGSFALRQGQYKLVAGSGDGTGKDKDASADAYFLYDLKNDPFEARDISAEEPEILKRMRSLLLKYQ